MAQSACKDMGDRLGTIVRERQKKILNDAAELLIQ